MCSGLREMWSRYLEKVLRRRYWKEVLRQRWLGCLEVEGKVADLKAD